MQTEITLIQNVITGERKLYAFIKDAWRLVGVVPRTQWKAVSSMQRALEDVCGQHENPEEACAICQSMIDAAPSVPPTDITAQSFDELKLTREGTPLGNLLRRSANGDRAATHQFPYAVMREEMIRTFGSHVVRFTNVAGEGLGSGVLIVLPNSAHAILTCSHVWMQLTQYQQIQIYCASTLGGLVLNQGMIQLNIDDLFTLDMADRDFMDKAGVDALLFKRDSAIIAGNIPGFLPKGARAFDLRAVAPLEPKSEGYALVGYPLSAGGELGAQLLEHASQARNSHVFTRHPKDKGTGSLNGASGGLVVAVRYGKYRPVGLMVEEQGVVEAASVNSRERSINPSAFHALSLMDLRAMMERAGKLPFRDRKGRLIREFWA